MTWLITGVGPMEIENGDQTLHQGVFSNFQHGTNTYMANSTTSNDVAELTKTVNALVEQNDRLIKMLEAIVYKSIPDLK